MTATEWQLVIALITILGSGVAVYVGVRVAIAELKRDQRSNEREIFRLRDEHGSRLDRLEAGYFKVE